MARAGWIGRERNPGRARVNKQGPDLTRGVASEVEARECRLGYLVTTVLGGSGVHLPNNTICSRRPLLLPLTEGGPPDHPLMGVKTKAC
jgi:hypothetical protein